MAGCGPGGGAGRGARESSTYNRHCKRLQSLRKFHVQCSNIHLTPSRHECLLRIFITTFCFGPERGQNLFQARIGCFKTALKQHHKIVHHLLGDTFSVL